MNQFTWFFDTFMTALLVVFLQNLIFAGGFGVTESISAATKPKQLFSFSVLIVYFSVVTAVISRLLDFIPFIERLNTTWHAAIYALLLFILYVITCIVLVLRLKEKNGVVRRVGMAAFNTLVLAVPLINHRVSFTFAESIGTGIGAGAAFIVAVLVINIGMHSIEKNDKQGLTPGVFRGTPAVFIYIAILALAFTGFAGRAILI
jgi:Na+-translocating ferredoxin:NAD+ oxidoreductase RnfA subunit